MFTKIDSLIDIYTCNKENHHTAFLARGGIQQILDEIAEELVVMLPHGSGIDYDWVVEHQHDLVFKCSNGYHAMDQNGMYCGCVGFDLTIDLMAPFPITELQVSREDIKAIYKDYEPDPADLEDLEEDEEPETNAPYLDDLDDYLCETISYSLRWYYEEGAIRYIKSSPYLKERFDQTQV